MLEHIYSNDRLETFIISHSKATLIVFAIQEWKSLNWKMFEGRWSLSGLQGSFNVEFWRKIHFVWPSLQNTNSDVKTFRILNDDVYWKVVQGCFHLEHNCLAKCLDEKKARSVLQKSLLLFKAIKDCMF